MGKSPFKCISFPSSLQHLNGPNTESKNRTLNRLSYIGSNTKNVDKIKLNRLFIFPKAVRLVFQRLVCCRNVSMRTETNDSSQ